MNNSRPCCRDLPDSRRSASPFDRIVALGFCDGPTEGFLRCRECPREYVFRYLDVREEASGEGELRAFGLSEIPAGSIAEFEAAMSPFDSPRSPYWVPRWSLPSEEDRETMEVLLNRLMARGASCGLIFVAEEWPTGEIQAAHFVVPGVSEPGKDWFASLEPIRVGGPND